MTKLDNLTIIQSTEKDDIFQGIAETGATVLNATNGTYTAPSSAVVPTTLAGYQITSDRFCGKSDALIMAINSDISMQDIAAEKAAKGEDIGPIEDQVTRARKVLEPLAQQFPGRKIIGVFYDESTPTALYEYLSRTSLELNALYKFGYGTNPNAGDIEGAVYYKHVLAFPFPNDAKALCDNLTKRTPGRMNYTVLKLTEEVAPNGQFYMTPDNKVLFDIAEGLEDYKATPTTPKATKAGSSPEAGLK